MECLSGESRKHEAATAQIRAMWENATAQHKCQDLKGKTTK
jgi:hypothetical protein